MDDVGSHDLAESKAASGQVSLAKLQCQGRPVAAAFESILYQNVESQDGQSPPGVPPYFRDLNLDQIVDTITSGKGEYNLKPYFYEPLKTPEAIAYRHEVMRDMEAACVHGCINSFADNLRLMRQKIAQADKLRHKYQKERWFLHAAEVYCTAVLKLQSDLVQLDLSSRGLHSFRDYVVGYARSEHFAQLFLAVNELTRDLAKIQLSILVIDNGFRVQNYAAESDYSAEVADVFRKFQQGAANEYLAQFRDYPDMTQVEETVLDFVVLLNPEVFSRLDAFYSQNTNYADPVLTKFDQEIQFYVAYIEYISMLKWAGLRFCYPQILVDQKDLYNEGGFDIALASKLVGKKETVVCNDFYLSGEERIFVVSGPNQGGKTTFARTFGQLHHLASIGCPVPGKIARIFLFDAILTHFEREEAINSLDGKLQDDLIRFHDLLKVATPRSIIIINEIFGAATLQDAVFLARKILGRIIELDSLCVCVTFLDELASLSQKTISIVSTVVPENPTIRTLKVVRLPADGRSYAVSIAEKYRLTYEWLISRIQF